MKKMIKLCGFCEESELDGLDSLEVDLVGFVFAPSKRQVQPERWSRLAKHVPAGLRKVGVFVNPTMEQLETIMALAPLEVIQLHGQESPVLCQDIKHRFKVEIIKAAHIGAGGDFSLPDDGYRPAIDYLLLDTLDAQAAGGTGRRFRWEVIPAFQRWCAESGIKLLIAGGITADNVNDLLRDWPLDGIDVSSGIETGGRKDWIKMSNLVERVKGHVNSAQ